MASEPPVIDPANPTLDAIQLLLSKVSIRPISHWLKQKGLKHTAKSKLAFGEMLYSLIESESVTLESLQAILIQIQEYASKSIHLFEGECRFRDKDAFKSHLRSLGWVYSDRPRPPVELPDQPTLNYASYDEELNEYYAKFTETHTNIKFDKATGVDTRTNHTNIIVLSQNANTGTIKIRLDKENSLHNHLNDNGLSDYASYLEFYKGMASNLFRSPVLNPKSLRAFISMLVSTDPRVFHIPVADIVSPDHFKNKMSGQIKNGDIRDSDMYIRGRVDLSRGFVLESMQGYWVPSHVADPRLTRPIFMLVSQIESKISFIADCLPEEINYVLSRVEEA